VCECVIGLRPFVNHFVKNIYTFFSDLGFLLSHSRPPPLARGYPSLTPRTRNTADNNVCPTNVPKSWLVINPIQSLVSELNAEDLSEGSLLITYCNCIKGRSQKIFRGWGGDPILEFYSHFQAQILFISAAAPETLPVHSRRAGFRGGGGTPPPEPCPRLRP